jgi:hypothetical protein
MRRLTVAVLVMIGGLAQLAAPAAAATSHGRQISDSTYSISFYVPSTWKHSVVTTSTSGTTKVLVEDVSGAIVVGLVQVQVIAGRNTNASAIAAGSSPIHPGSQDPRIERGEVPFRQGRAAPVHPRGIGRGCVRHRGCVLPSFAHLHRGLRRHGSFYQRESPLRGDDLLGHMSLRVRSREMRDPSVALFGDDDGGSSDSCGSTRRPLSRLSGSSSRTPAS